MNDEAKVKASVNVDHVAKQKKRKDLSNEYVYASINGVVEMFPLGIVTLSKRGGKTLNEVFESYDKRLDTSKEIIKELLGRVKILEGKIEKYGLE